MCIIYIHWFVKHIIIVIQTAQFEQDDVLFGKSDAMKFHHKTSHHVYNLPLAQFDGTYTEIIYG